MSRTLLQLVLRHADATAADGTDTDLLRRYHAARDESAFAALVRRHGPMVWAVCRQVMPNRTDAEDVFQAVFFALARSAKSVRQPEYLASWLHGAAVRIAAKAKRGHARRASRERTAATAEASIPVAGSMWGEAMAAVHTEVDRLPPSLKTALVLCDLEGLNPADAAARAGVKLNTLSGQLARARQRLLDRLSKRGLGAAAVATAGAAAIGLPAALATQAMNVTTAGMVPASVIELATEVTAMHANKLKLLVAGLLLTLGLAGGVGAWLANAHGQAPPGALPGGPGGPGAGLPGAGAPGAPPGGIPGGPGGLGGPGAGIGPGGSGEGEGGGVLAGYPAQFPYLYVAKPSSLLDVQRLGETKARQNWELVGSLDVDSVDLAKATADEKRMYEGVTDQTRKVLVFKRAVRHDVPGPGGGMGMGSPPGLGGVSGQAGGPGAPADASRVFRLKNVTADDAAKALREVFNGKGNTSRVTIAAEPTTNSLIVTKASDADMKVIEELLKKTIDTDRAGGGVGPGTGGAQATQANLEIVSGVLSEELAKSLAAAIGTGADVKWTAFVGSKVGNTNHFAGTESGLESLKKVVAALDPKAKFASRASPKAPMR